MMAGMNAPVIPPILVLVTGFGLAAWEFWKRCRKDCGEDETADLDENAFTPDEVFDLLDGLTDDIEFLKRQTLVDQAAFAIAVENLEGADALDAAQLDPTRPERPYRMLFEWLRGQFAAAEDGQAAIIAVQRQVEKNVTFRLRELGREQRTLLEQHSGELEAAWIALMQIDKKVTEGFVENRKDHQRTHEKLAEIGEALRQTPPPADPNRPRDLKRPPMPPDRFIGRETDLVALYEKFAVAPTANGEGMEALAITQPETVRGTGGIGKTTLARQIAWALYLSGKVDAAFEITAGSPEELRTNLAGLAKVLATEQNTAGTDIETDIALVLGWFGQHPQRWLLILDNVDSSEARAAVYDILGPLTGGRVLITSRLDQWSADKVTTRPLDRFRPDEAREFLQSRHRDWHEDDGSETVPEMVEAFDAIARELEYHTLGLEIAAAYLRKYRKTPAEFLDHLRTRLAKVLAFDHENVDHPLPLEALWDASVEPLTERCPAAVRLLELFAWLAPEPFPVALLEEIGTDEAGEFLTGGSPDAWDADEVIAELHELGLIEWQTTGDLPTVRVHRLIQTVTRHRLEQAGDSAALDSLIASLDLLNEKVPSPCYDPVGWLLWDALEPHLTAALGYEAGQVAESNSPFSKCLGRLMNQFAFWLRERSESWRAEPLYLKAIAINEKIFGEQHSSLVKFLNNLAILYSDTGCLVKAEPLFQRAISICEKGSEADNLDLASALNNLGELYRAKACYKEAEPLYKRAMAIDEKILGADHPDLGTDLNNLALLYQSTGRFQEAELLIGRAILIGEKGLGVEHPILAIWLSNLAFLYESTARFEQANPLYERVVTILARASRLVGRHLPNLAPAMENYAIFLQKHRNLSEAEAAARVAEVAGVLPRE